MPHDPERQAGYVRQSLAQGRRPLGFLIGAGCPTAIRVASKPLIPDVAGLTEQIRAELGKSGAAPAWKTLESQFPSDANVEIILSHIRSLRAVAGSDEIRGILPDDLDALESSICGTIAEVAGKSLPARDTPYHRLASWIGSSVRAYPVEVFTPNYDLLMEQALEETRVPYFDGFVGSVEPFFDLHAIEVDPVPPRWARLWKIHGSINWDLGARGTVFRRSRLDPSQVRVIYPSHLKYEESRRMPYLALFDRLRTFLRQPSAVLITCGFSFRDDHLNEVLLDGAEGNPGAIIFGLLHGDLDDYSTARSIATNRANLTLLAADGGVVGTREDDWPALDAPPEPREPIAVEWKPEKGGKAVRARFTLGDFNRLGLLLADILGAPMTSTDNDAN